MDSLVVVVLALVIVSPDADDDTVVWIVIQTSLTSAVAIMMNIEAANKKVIACLCSNS